MKVAIVHYHLQPGGVTRIIEAQSRALRLAGIEHVVLAGTPGDERPDLPVVVVPSLRYGREPEASTGAELLRALRQAAREALASPPDLWHFHNPTLGKNALFPSLLEELASAREHLVLHVHDFAEDGRPREYKALGSTPRIYPIAPQIRYATINSRDRAHLIAAGAPPERTVLLPNALLPPEPADRPPRASGAPPTVLYPVRGIGRKNLGEFCLLAGLAPREVQFALSRAPENPRWLPVYDRWRALASHHQLPAHFGVVGSRSPAPGLDPSYQNWLGQASHLLTTSVAEGFGLAFLEPIALRKPLFGRDLPDITIDFKSHQIDLGPLYDQVLIPADWIDSDTLRRHLTEALQHLFRSYEMPLPPELPRDVHHSLLHHDHLDFANLPVDLQVEVLPRALQSPAEVLMATPDCSRSAPDWLATALDGSHPSAPSSSLSPYSLERYSEHLATLYQDVLNAPPVTPSWLDRSRLLHEFFTPERFHFLRC